MTLRIIAFLVAASCLAGAQGQFIFTPSVKNFMRGKKGGDSAPEVCSLGVTGMGQTNTTTAAATYTLARSNTPPANALMLVSVMNTHGTVTHLPTLTGLGVQWVMVGTTNETAGMRRLSLFRSMTNNTPTADAIVAAFGGTNQTGCNMHGVYFTNVLTTGSQGSAAIVQAVQTTNNTDNPTMTLAAYNGSTNAAMMFLGNSVNGFDASLDGVEVGWTGFITNGFNTPASGQFSCWQLNATDTTPSIDSSAATIWLGIAVEIQKACP